MSCRRPSFFKWEWRIRYWVMLRIQSGKSRSAILRVREEEEGVPEGDWLEWDHHWFPHRGSHCPQTRQKVEKKKRREYGLGEIIENDANTRITQILMNGSLQFVQIGNQLFFELNAEHINELCHLNIGLAVEQLDLSLSDRRNERETRTTYERRNRLEVDDVVGLHLELARNQSSVWFVRNIAFLLIVIKISFRFLFLVIKMKWWRFSEAYNLKLVVCQLLILFFDATLFV